MNPVTYKKLTHAMESKVTDRFSSGRERSTWIQHRGVKLLRLTIPKVHPNDIPGGTLKSIKEDLELGDADFIDLCNCPFTRQDFERHLDAILLSRRRPPLPAPVSGFVIQDDARLPYDAYELNRLRFAWAMDGASYKTIKVFLQSNPERQWAPVARGLTEDEARDEAALAYLEALAAEDPAN